MKEDRTRASFDQIGFVYSNKIGNNTSLRFVNFGFNYHKSKNFNRLFSMGGILDNGLEGLIRADAEFKEVLPEGKTVRKKPTNGRYCGFV